MRQSIESLAETGHFAPLQSDSYTVQKVGLNHLVCNPDGVVIGECQAMSAAIEYANKQNAAHGLKLLCRHCAGRHSTASCMFSIDLD